VGTDTRFCAVVEGAVSLDAELNTVAVIVALCRLELDFVICVLVGYLKSKEAYQKLWQLYKVPHWR